MDCDICYKMRIQRMEGEPMIKLKVVTNKQFTSVECSVCTRYNCKLVRFGTVDVCGINFVHIDVCEQCLKKALVMLKDAKQ